MNHTVASMFRGTRIALYRLWTKECSMVSFDESASCPGCMCETEGGEIVYDLPPSLWQGFRHAVVATVMAFGTVLFLLLLTNFVTIKPTAPAEESSVRGTRDQVLQPAPPEPSLTPVPVPPQRPSR